MITKKNVEHLAIILKHKTQKDYYISYQMGKAKLHLVVDKETLAAREITDRISTRDMYFYLLGCVETLDKVRPI